MAKKQGPRRDAKGRVVAGGGSLNPGGLSSEHREVAEKLSSALRKADFQKAWKVAYLALLKDANPVIVKDYADRLMGKAKELVEVTGKDGAPLQYDHAFKTLTREVLLKLAGVDGGTK
jgi:hypothetical protein